MVLYYMVGTSFWQCDVVLTMIRYTIGLPFYDSGSQALYLCCRHQGCLQAGD